jgi:hypothetical protein
MQRCLYILGASVGISHTPCQGNMPKKPDVEALLPMLVDIAKDRPDIISAEEFRNILVDMGLALEKAEEPKNPKLVTT